MPTLAIGNLIIYKDTYAYAFEVVEKGSIGLIYEKKKTRYRVLLNNGMRSEVTSKDLEKDKIDIIAT
jgi:hypothetical protein